MSVIAISACSTCIHMHVSHTFKPRKYYTTAFLKSLSCGFVYVCVHRNFYGNFCTSPYIYTIYFASYDKQKSSELSQEWNQAKVPKDSKSC